MLRTGRQLHPRPAVPPPIISLDPAAFPIHRLVWRSRYCPAGEFPCCVDQSQQATSGYGDGSWSFCNTCPAGMTRQSACPGTPEGLISMGSDDRAHDVTMDGTVLPSGDFGECSYRSDWGWVVRAMWVTPAPAAGDVATFVWSDGSPLDYTDWFGEAIGALARTNEDEVELRMGCDIYACFHGQVTALPPRVSTSADQSLCWVVSPTVE